MKNSQAVHVLLAVCFPTIMSGCADATADATSAVSSTPVGPADATESTSVARSDLGADNGMVQTFASVSGITATLGITQDKEASYCAKVVVTNKHPVKATSTWAVTLDVGDATIQDGYAGGSFSARTKVVRLTPGASQRVLAPGVSTSATYCAQKTSASNLPVISAVTSSLPVATGPGWKAGNYRIVSAKNRLTLHASTDGLVTSTFDGSPQQQWRFESSASSAYRITTANASGTSCINAVGSTNQVGEQICNGTSFQWDIEVLAEATTDGPGRYRLRDRTTRKCLAPSSATVGSTADPTVSVQIATLGSCDSSAELYLEPSGWGERAYRPAIRFNLLNIAKPILAADASTSEGFPFEATGTLPDEIVQASQYAFTDKLASWVDAMTDGRIWWQGAAVTSAVPIVSLTCDNSRVNTSKTAGFSVYFTICEPGPLDLAADFASYVPNPGTYDGVFFVWHFAGIRTQVSPEVTVVASAHGGDAWAGSADTNYAYMARVNQALVHKGNPTAAQWRSETDVEPAVVYLHEFLEQLTLFYQTRGVKLPKSTYISSVHGGETAQYAEGTQSMGWNHWHRDYLLGTVIEDDGTYVGLGPRAFARGAPSSAAPRF